MLFSPDVLFTNLTRANEIGANSYLLDFGNDGSVVLDAGMHPKLDGYGGTPNFAPVDSKSLKGIFLTHAHHDHTGALPVLMRAHPEAKCFMSEPTFYLADPLLHNSVEVMIKQRDEYNIPEYPLFTHGELGQLVQRWVPCGLETPLSFSGQKNPVNDPLSFAFYDAGHILGSVGVLLNHRGRNIFYTGDINFADQTLMKAASFPTKGIDVLITETTRGSAPGKKGGTRKETIERLLTAIEETFSKGGAVMIPIFAMGKTQELLAEVYLQWKKGRIGKRPLYIGGLSKNFSVIYDKLASRSTRNHPEMKLLNEGMPEIMDGRKLRNFKPRKGDFYLISSGMMNEKTLSNILGQKFISDPRHAIFFVGYCDPDSPAGRMLATPMDDYTVLASLAGEQQKKCRVEHFDLTAHAQREDILDYILEVNPKTCMLVHGDQPALEWFQGQLSTLRPEMKIVVPPAGQTVEI